MMRRDVIFTILRSRHMTADGGAAKRDAADASDAAAPETTRRRGFRVRHPTGLLSKALLVQNKT